MTAKEALSKLDLNIGEISPTAHTLCSIISKEIEELLHKKFREAKYEAVKEFAEKLKEKFEGYEATCYNGVEEGWHDLKEEIDDLLKEYEI